MKNALKWSAFALLCIALAVAGFAQTTGGGLQGKVTDDKGEPVIGATIQVTGPSLPGFQGAATDINGEFRIPYLPPGKAYTVKIEASGFGTVIRQDIEIPLGVTINLPIKLGTGTTEMIITGAPPIIDNRKTEGGAVLSDQVILDIPLGRESSGIAMIVPGVVDSGGLGNASPSISGASGLENSYTVNGIEMQNSGNAENFATLNFEFIEATEVKTGGLDAEYGGLMGGAINSITKSGGNEFRGGVFAYYFSDSMQAQSRAYDNPSVAVLNPDFVKYDIGAFIGGYIVKDKLWFFASYDYNSRKTTYNALTYYSARLNINGAPMPSWANGKSLDYPYTDPQYAFKLTWNLSQNHKLNFSFFGDRSKYSYWQNLRNVSPVASSQNDLASSYALSAQWNATWTPKFFTEMIIGTRRTWVEERMGGSSAAMSNYMYYNRYGSDQIIPWDMANNIPANWTGNNSLLNLWGTVTPSLGSGYYQSEKDYNDQLRFKATNIFSFMGKHELSYGLQYFDVKYDRLQSYSGGPILDSDIYDPFYGQSTSRGAVIRWQRTNMDFNGNGTGDDFYFRVYRSHMNDNNKKTKQQYKAFFLQDNWNLTDYFMLKLGVRLDTLEMSGGTNLKLVPNALGPGGPYGYMTYGVGSIQVTPKRTVKINNMWAPRVGFTWDPFHNGKSKLYGFYGWYYERIPNDLAIRSLTTEWGWNAYFQDPYLTVPLSDYLGYPINFTNGFDETIVTGSPNGGSLKGSYNTEALLGFQYEVMTNLQVGVRTVYRELGRAIEDISTDGANQYIVTNPDNWTDVWVPDPITGESKWRFPRPIRRYVGLEFTVDKRFSNNWFMGGSYVLSELQGNYDGLYSPANGQVDANITSSFDLPQLLQNGYGLLSLDRTHVLKAYGGYHFDWGLDLNGYFIYQSGTPYNKYGSDELYGPNEAFLTPRGSAGRLPGTWKIDIGAQYNIKLAKTNLGLRLDIFNITNNQVTTDVDELYNETNNDPDLKTNPYWGYEVSHQAPRSVRVAVRWTF